MQVRVVLAEGHPALRAALRSLLTSEPDIELSCEARDTEQLLELVTALQPGVVVLDVDLPGPGCVETTRRLADAVPGTRVLLFTAYRDLVVVRDAVIAGAAGCVVKRSADKTLATAIRAVSEGQFYMRAPLVRTLLADLFPQTAESGEVAQKLTPPEVAVLRLIAQGYTNCQVAEELRLSIRMVESHREKIMSKLNLHNRAGLVRYAAAHGLNSRCSTDVLYGDHNP